MRILVTGGTGVVGNGLIPALLEAKHRVRLLTRHAERDADVWPDAVEARSADVAEPASMAGAADGCDAVIHVAGIVKESPPGATFERVNVVGTRGVVREAERSGVPRLLYLSSLGADAGRSPYHASKRRAERVVRAFTGAWTILRPGNVYGPGDGVISTLLTLVRSLPAIPIVDDGEQRFQPIWHEDLGRAIARVLERQDLAGRTLELAGAEITTVNGLLDRLESLGSRRPARVPVPASVASAGLTVAERLPGARTLARLTGIDLPFDTSKLTMLQEENVIRPPSVNALTDVLGVSPLPLDEGLRRLAESLPEQLPGEGVGALERKRFWAVIQGGRYPPPELMELFRSEAHALLPIAFMDGGGRKRLEQDDTIGVRLPYRGEIQVRVEEANERCVTLATLEGHPLAGVVRFGADIRDGGVRFMVEVFARPANLVDLLLMKAGGDAVQRSTWEEAVRRVVERSGGNAVDGVRHDTIALDEDEARGVEDAVARLVRDRRMAGQAKRPG